MTTFIPKVTQLSPRIIRVLGCNPGHMTLQGTNTYLIGTGKKRVLLDTGEENNSEYISNLMKVLKEHNTNIEQIIISHWHLDHIGGLTDVINQLSSPVKASKYPLEYSDDDVDDYLSDFELTSLEDKHEIKIEGATLKVHHTPGHTTDHIILELLEENAVFSGDCILGEGTAIFEDLHSYINSLHKILKVAPATIYPGHGPVIDDPVDRIKHYITHRNMREQQIVETLKANSDKPLTSMEIVKIIYKDIPEHLHPAADINVQHHLSKLLKDKVASESDDKWSINIHSSI